MCYNGVAEVNRYNIANNSNCIQHHNEAIDDSEEKAREFSKLLNLDIETTGCLHYEIFYNTYICLYAHGEPIKWDVKRNTVFNQYTTECFNDSLLTTLCDVGSSECFSPNKICTFERDIYGNPVHCSDTQHLRYCASHECPNAFKCRGSYCIPNHMVCDMILDCPDGEDEHDCDEVATMGMFR